MGGWVDEGMGEGNPCSLYQEGVDWQQVQVRVMELYSLGTGQKPCNSGFA